MRKIIPILLIFMVIALSGCIGSSSQGENDQATLTFEHENLNLDATIVDLKLAPADVRAGEKVTAKLVIANSGTDDIFNETIEIKAKVKSLDDIFANLALKVMSDDAKTRTFTMGFNENVKPGTIKPISAVFHTQQELQGRSLAGTYDVTVILSVNGQKVVGKVLPVTLRPGKPRDNASDSNPNATPAPTVAVTAGPTTTMTPGITVAPTPVPTPEAVTVDTYLFSWNDVPGNDSARLIGFLKNRFGIDWVETAKIEKIDASVTNLTSGKNFISLQLNEEKTILGLIIDDGRTDEFIAMNENGKLNIYSGKFKFTRIKSWTFGEPSITIDAGDWIQWQNLWDDEDTYTLVEMNGKFPNITVKNRRDQIFNRTGTYNFELYYPKMRVSPPVQTIVVKLNQT